MKVGLTTALRDDCFDLLELRLKRTMPNLALLYLAGFLEKQKLEAELIIEDKFERLVKKKPDVLGISSVTENFQHAIELAKRAKALWNPLIIIGGVHVTSLPHVLPEVFDIAVIGEGEETFFDLLSTYQKKQKLGTDWLSQIKGVSYHDGGKVHFTGFRKGISSLDEIPVPDRNRFGLKYPYTYMMTSRGCPYTCSFCVIPHISEGYRMHSADYVVDEIKSIREIKPNPRRIRIFDDLYIVNKKRTLEIAEKVHAEGLNQEFDFVCWARANLLDKEMIAALIKMNMKYVEFGAESGSSQVFSKIKPGCAMDENQRAIDMLYDNGLYPSCSIIMGHPLETEQDLMATYEFIEKNSNKLLGVEFNTAIPWPGTDLWDYAKERGWVHDAMDFSTIRECIHFPNYSTKKYPYLNEKIAPERYESILEGFRELFWKFENKQTKLEGFMA